MKNTSFKQIFRIVLLCTLTLSVLLCAGCQKKPASTGDPAPSTSGGDGDFEFFLSCAEAKAGEEITVSLSIKNNPSVAGYSVTVCYDPQVLTFVDCKNKVSGGFAVSNSTEKGKVRVMCTVMGGNVLSHEGVSDELTFTVKSDAPAGTSELGLILADAADSVYKTENGAMPPVACTLRGGAVTVK